MIRLHITVTFDSGLTVTYGNIASSDGAIAAAVAKICRLFPDERKIAHQAF